MHSTPGAGTTKKDEGMSAAENYLLMALRAYREALALGRKLAGPV